MQKLFAPRWALALFAALYVAGALVAAVLAVANRPSRQLFVSDGFGYYAYLPALVTNHSLDFQPIYREPEARQFGKFADGLLTPIGRAENPFTVGPALVWWPGYVLARGLAALGLFNQADPRPLGLATQAVVWAWASLIGLLGLAAAYDLVRSRYGNVPAAAALLLGFWGTPVAAYLLFETGFSHSVAFALLAIFFWLSDRLRTRSDWLAGWVLAGLMVGLAGSVRPTLLAAAVGVVPVLWTLLKTPARLWRPILCFTVPLIAGVAPQFAVWKLLYGSFVPNLSNTSWGHVDPTHPHLADVLLSLDHGLFTWTPIWLVAVVALVVLVRREPAWGLAILALFVVHLWTIAMNPNWNGDGAFGQRKFVDIAVVFFVGLGYLVARVMTARPPVRTAALTLALLLSLQNLGLMARYYTHRLPQSGPITVRQLWGI